MEGECREDNGQQTTDNGITKAVYLHAIQPALHTSFSIAPPRYTYDDYKNWSNKWELIEGYPYALMPSCMKVTGFKYYLLADTEKEKVEVYELINNVYIIKPDKLFQFAGECETELSFDDLWRKQ